jgi:hypothetical protein
MVDAVFSGPSEEGLLHSSSPAHAINIQKIRRKSYAAGRT